MQKKDFLYFLTDASGRCYKLDDRGMVVVDNDIRPLANTPDGWQDKMINYARSKTYRGTIRTFTFPLKFVTDGAKIIRYLFYSGGVQAECFLRIAKLNRSTGVHEPYYVGSLDFSTFEDDKTGRYVEINVLDTGFAPDLKSNEDTTYEIPIGPDEKDPIESGVDPRVRVKLDGINLRGTLNYTSLTGAAGLHDTTWHWLDLLYVNQEGTLSNLDHHDVDFQEIENPDDIPGSTKWVIEAKKDVTITLNLEFDIDIRPETIGDSSVFNIWVGKTSSAKVSSLTNGLSSGDGPDSINYTGANETTVSLTAGEHLYIYASVEQGITMKRAIIQYNILNLKVSALTRFDTTFCYALRPSFIFERLIHKITNGKAGTKSDLLDGNDDPDGLYTVLVTTGNALRRLDGPIVKTTFKDFLTAMNAIWNIGFGIDQIPDPSGVKELGIIEEIAHFFDPFTIVTDLGDVSDLKVTPYVEELFNRVNIGYPEQTYDDVNGKDEFNTTAEFSTPLSRVKQALDLVSPWRADMYGIEFTRINLDGLDTTDNSADDDIFFLVCKSQPLTDDDGEYYELYRAAGSTISGLIAGDTAFNIEISPKRNLLRHGNYLHGILDKLEGASLKFQTTSKNDTLSVTYPAPPIPGAQPVTITEADDVPISKLPAKLYLPYVIEFNTIVPKGVKQLFDANPRGLVKFSWKGEEFTGFILDCSIKPSFNEAQTWKLIAGPNNDMTKLI